MLQSALTYHGQGFQMGEKMLSPTRKSRDTTFSRFGRTPTCDGQTDRHMTGLTGCTTVA